jgi:heme A synthase
LARPGAGYVADRRAPDDYPAEYSDFRAHPKGHAVRRGAAYAGGFILLEALLGAGLVLLELVAHNATVDRAIAVSLHLLNTFLLLGALTLTAWWATTGTAEVRVVASRGLQLALLACAIGMAFIGASGAIVALGDTLFPASSLAQGIQQELDPTMSFLVRLRVVHPAIAIVVGIGLIALASHVRQHTTSRDARHAAGRLTLLVFVQWMAGLANVALLAPVWLQLGHLLLADLIWVSLVLLAAVSLTATTADEPAPGLAVGT